MERRTLFREAALRTADREGYDSFLRCHLGENKFKHLQETSTYAVYTSETKKANLRRAYRNPVLPAEPIGDQSLEYDYLFPWPGMKTSQVGRTLHRYFPSHYTRYVDPFGGSASCMLARIKEAHHEEVFNDKDELIYNFVSILKSKSDTAKLVRLVEDMSFTRSGYDYAIKQLTRLRTTHVHPVQRAFWFLVLCYQSERAQCHPLNTYVSQWGLNYKDTNRNRWECLPQHLLDLAERFAGVRVHCLDYREVMEQYASKDTFFFLDPPYHPDTAKSGYDRFYAHRMSWDDHLELCEFLDRHHESKIMLVGNPNEMYDIMLGERFRYREIAFASAGTALRRKKSVLGIWTNYWDDNSHLLN